MTKSKKIRIYPDTHQREILRQWVGVSRFVYNRTVEYLQQPDTKANWKEIKTGILHNLPEWCQSVPYQIKSAAIRDACNAVKKAKRDTKQTGNPHCVKFRSRKNNQQSIYIPKSAITELGVYHTLLKKLTLSENLPDNIRDSRLIKDGTHFYLCVSYSVITQKREPSGRVIALDPGIRTFLTYFSETGFGWIGHHAINKIQRLCAHLDDLLSRASQCPRPRRRNMRRAANRMRQKIHNLVDELHKKTARWLVDNFDIILLPTFETQDMSKRNKRKLRKKSVKQMLTLSHFRFKQYLKHKAKETSIVVIDVNEAWTSKTVSWTGKIVDKLGGAKVIKDFAGNVMDRDLNGARGIFLRALGDNPALLAISSVANHTKPDMSNTICVCIG